jgi:hypothetical protein
MARKRVYPKPVPRLTTESSKLLGKNSNFSPDVNRIAIYSRVPVVKSNINDRQLKELITLRRNLGAL